MSLKSKAITTHSIWVDEEYGNGQFEDLEWIPLVEAQEIERQKNTAENLRKIAYQIRDECLQTNNQLVERIAEATKHLEADKAYVTSIMEGEKLSGANHDFTSQSLLNLITELQGILGEKSPQKII